MNSVLSSALYSILFEIKSAKFCGCVPNKGSSIGKSLLKNGMVTRLILNGFPGSRVKRNPKIRSSHPRSTTLPSKAPVGC